MVAKEHQHQGYGAQRQWQVNTKFVQPIGPVKLTGFFNYSDRAENDYQDLSLAMIRKLGYGVDNISHDWPVAVQIANLLGANAPDSAYPAPYNKINSATDGTDPADAVYFNGSGLREDALGALRADWDVTEGLSVHLMGYGPPQPRPGHLGHAL